MSSVNLLNLVVLSGLDEIVYRVYEGRLDENGGVHIAVYPILTPQAVQRRLDEVAGPHRWQSKLSSTAHGILCEISIEVEPGQWVTKSDVAPDADGDLRAFVRAAAAWGIGRDLLSAPLEMAQVVAPGTKGSRTYEIGSKTFHWLPPSSDKIQTPMPSYIPKQAQTALKGQSLSRPSVQDPSLAVVPFGYTKGKMLKELSEKELSGLISFYEKATEPQGKARFFKEAFLDFLNKRAGRAS